LTAGSAEVVDKTHRTGVGLWLFYITVDVSLDKEKENYPGVLVIAV
jgi:hypothetical protein